MSLKLIVVTFIYPKQDVKYEGGQEHMVKTPVLLYKTLVIGIIILLFGMSIVSSTSKIVDDIPSYIQILDIKDSSEELFRGNYGYAYNAYPSPEGTVYFPLDDPGNITECGGTISCDFLAGGTIDSYGIWYAVQYGNGLLYGIDTNNHCEMWSIGGGGMGMRSLALDDETYTLYGISDADYLYKIDPETGEQDQIGSIDISFIEIKFDNTGTFYGFELNSSGYNIYTIDFSPFETTLVGTITNITATWVFSAAFDKDTNNLYLLTDGLYICNTETWECTLIGYIGGIELTAFVIPYGNDDTTPPVTTHTLDPPEPDGLNGWYVNDVKVTLTATDISGVKEIRYYINGGPEQIIAGDNSSFILYEDGDDILIEYWAIDNVGNVETPKNSFIIDIDQTVPGISLSYEVTGGNPIQGWEYTFTATATDDMSGMERVEFYANDYLQETVYGSGPEYSWVLQSHLFYNTPFKVRGLILNPKITDEHVMFYAMIIRISRFPIHLEYRLYAYAYDIAGNHDYDEIEDPCYPSSIRYGIYLFENVTLPNNYRGFIGNNFIFAIFDTS